MEFLMPNNPEWTGSGVAKGAGGVKGAKLARFDLVPPESEVELAQVYGKGSEKYEDRNWEKGFDWSLSIAAMERHIKKFKAGEDLDDETGLHHLAHAAWHCFALIAFRARGIGKDDRTTEASLDAVLSETLTNPEIFATNEDKNADAGPDAAPTAETLRKRQDWVGGYSG
jgi:hypothetical protein